MKFPSHDYDCPCGRCTRVPADRAAPSSFRHAVPVEQHRAIIRGDQRGLLSVDEPRWSCGATVVVSTAPDPDRPLDSEPATRMEVTSVEAVPVSKLTAEHARRVGLKLATEVQRLALGIDDGRPAPFVQARAAGCQTPVFITRLARVEADTVRLLGKTVGYTSSSAMEVAGSAGEAPPVGWLPERTVDQYRGWLPEKPTDAAGSLAASAAVEGHRLAAQQRTAAQIKRRRSDSNAAKSKLAMAASTRRRRIETARTANSRVAEAPAPEVFESVLLQQARACGMSEAQARDYLKMESMPTPRAVAWAEEQIGIVREDAA